MSFFWVILIFVILFLFAIDPVSFGGWTDRWVDLGVYDYGRPVSDFEIRSKYRKRDCAHVPTIAMEEIPGIPDTILDLLIHEGRLDEANAFRMRQLQIAREHKDLDRVISYEAYRNLIVKREIEIINMRRSAFKSDYREKKRGRVIPANLSSDPMALPGETVAAPGVISEPASEADDEETDSAAFLPVELPLDAAFIKKETAIAEKITSDEKDYEELISI
jgi:hypothetical protein